jgi:hypothetical protein
MRLRYIPRDVVISVSFVAVFLLAFFPVAWLFAPDLWLALRKLRHAYGEVNVTNP